ncbi:MAG: ribose 5-phosphate isomerase B [Syntrophales bacterium]|nr:ribose 5-phosphate isomerase B [Syntrophales bacterium]
MRIIIGADHAGFRLKESVKEILNSWGITIEDVGTKNDEPCDYPDFAVQVAIRISRGEYDRGILVCGSGAGMVIVANRFPRVRAVLCMTEEMARLARRHNDANCLVLAGRLQDPEVAKKILHVWWETPFEGGRHAKRLEKIAAIEDKICTGRL